MRITVYLAIDLFADAVNKNRNIFNSQLELKFKEENNEMLHLEHRLVGC
jgi:hypothetical protein